MGGCWMSKRWSYECMYDLKQREGWSGGGELCAS